MMGVGNLVASMFLGKPIDGSLAEFCTHGAVGAFALGRESKQFPDYPEYVLPAFLGRDKFLDDVGE